MQMYKEAAVKNRAMVVHTYSDIEEGIQKKQADQFDIKKSDLPVLVGYIPRGNHVIKSDVDPRQHTQKTLKDFSEQIGLGLTKPIKAKSEDDPKNDDALVKTIVNRNFRRKV